jgi:AcrR family transcriptional regulator
MAKPVHHSDTRQQLLRAALKHFANSGYAATSVQDIVDDAKLSKPALYYHFKDKAGLFQALVHEAHDERYRVLCEAAQSDENLPAQLESILRALFAFFRANRELMRIAFATMFAAPGEIPADLDFEDKCERNFEFVHALFQRAQKNGELDARFDCEAMAFGFYGVANMYLVGHLVRPDCQPDQLTAKRIVELFLAGAGPKARPTKTKKTNQGTQ